MEDAEEIFRCKRGESDERLEKIAKMVDFISCSIHHIKLR
jgi:hypothetical protein